MIRRARQEKSPHSQQAVYIPSAAEIRRSTAEVQQRWTSRQRSRRAIGRTRNVEYHLVSPDEPGQRWIPGMI
jgi:hypothetical protein